MDSRWRVAALIWPLVGFTLLAGVLAANVQQPLSAPSSPEADEHQFKWPIHRVAIIGAGPSGLAAYRELTEIGMQVRIFERESVPGGAWHYTEELPLDAPVPNAPAPIGDFVPSLPPPNVDLPYSEELEDDGEIRRAHRGPKPIYESLTSNVPPSLFQFPQWPWPAGTPWQLSHYQIRNYLRSFASFININSNDDNPAAAYNTRVERVEKRINQDGEEQGWRLWLKSLEPSGRNTYRATWWTEDFDAVVVAAGKYYAPSMPSIPGLEEWVQRFPDRIYHSRQYRRPEAFRNQTVLIIGASVSGCEISRDLNREAGEIYISIRPNNGSKPLVPGDYRSRIPKNTTVVGEIKRFLPITPGSPVQSGLVELTNGTILSGIDSVICATGFRHSYPFLSQYYDGATEPQEGPPADPFLPLDGTYIRALYLDVFYIRDPTLAFLGVNTGTVVPLAGEYISLALAKVWTGTAKLPSEQTMWDVHQRTVEKRGGYGKYALFQTPNEFIESIRFLIGWLNAAAVKYGGKQVDGIPKDALEIARWWVIAYFAPEQDDQMGMSLKFGWS